MKKKKLLFLFMIFICIFTFIPNVNAENLTKAMLDNGIIKPIVVEDKKDGE